MFPTWLKVILIIHLFAFGGFCVYGMTGLKFKEEKTPVIRKIAAYLCGLAVIVFIICILEGWLVGPYHDEDEIKEIRQEAYEDGYYDAYNEWYAEGFNDGYNSGLDDGYEIGLDDASE